jgi:hypothetical protein
VARPRDVVSEATGRKEVPQEFDAQTEPVSGVGTGRAFKYVVRAQVSRSALSGELGPGSR